MDADALRVLLDDVASGEVEPDDAVRRLQRLPFADIGIARVDHHRALRQGVPEAVYGPGKTAEDVALVVAELLEGDTWPVVLSRAEKAQAEAALAVDGGKSGRFEKSPLPHVCRRPLALARPRKILAS